jgi:hypothetical protein
MSEKRILNNFFQLVYKIKIVVDENMKT